METRNLEVKKNFRKAMLHKLSHLPPFDVLNQWSQNRGECNNRECKFQQVWTLHSQIVKTKGEEGQRKAISYNNLQLQL